MHEGVWSAGNTIKTFTETWNIETDNKSKQTGANTIKRKYLNQIKCISTQNTDTSVNHRYDINPTCELDGPYSTSHSAEFSTVFCSSIASDSSILFTTTKPGSRLMLPTPSPKTSGLHWMKKTNRCSDLEK